MSAFIGIDCGSVSLKAAVLDASGSIVSATWTRHRGRPLELALETIASLAAEHPAARFAFAGSSGKLLARVLDAPLVNELAAFAAATARLHPQVRTIIEMGGEDSKLILMEEGRVKDFSLNSVCAAGTGSFLDQQAERMRLSIEDFASLAAESENPPHIAGRCSVFAKSDMIHLQQVGASVEDIAAGLCFAVARNFKGSIARGRPMPEPIAFLGGVSRNQGVVRAFREVLGVEQLLIPDHATQMGAIGAIIKAMDEDTAETIDVSRLEAFVAARDYDEDAHAPLRSTTDAFDERHLPPPDHVVPEDAGRDVYMGIDVGSISTNLAVIDEAGNLLAKRYLRTASRPIEAVRQGLSEIGPELEREIGAFTVRGVGTTGSGRYMIADFTGADIVKNEITAQARAAAFIDPDVESIFEIGGQDSKYIALDKGVIVDFEMNKACAAGTGSFLEEQAEKLGIDVKGEFAERALGAGTPCQLGERCTVFMENSLMAGLERGAGKDDLLAGLAYSIVENYINRVVAGRPIGKKIFFQGGTAYNFAVRAAFEKFLGAEIVVPPNFDVTGAIGMALIARDHMKQAGAQSTFRGFDLATVNYSLKSFICKSCENRCEINSVIVEGRDKPLCYGGRCEKYDQAKRPESTTEDLFAFRETEQNRAQEAYRAAWEAGQRPAPRGAIGLPRIFFFHDFMPYFATMLWELGFEVRVSPPTNRRIVHLGSELVLADTCFPVKAAQGHVRWLLERGTTTIFMPSFIDLTGEKRRHPTSLTCPLTQSLPYQFRQSFPEADIVAPPVLLRYGQKRLMKALKEHLAPYGVGSMELSKAMNRAAEAQAAFAATIQDKGREALADLEERDEKALAVVGRPYNAFDMGMNLEIPRKLASLGVRSIPFDFLPDPDVRETWSGMYWRSGQRILRAARHVRTNPRLNALFIGNFQCGPDSFILKFLDREMGGKPMLTIEIDEHSADAGVITRCEAFLDSLEMQAGTQQAIAEPEPVRMVGYSRGRTVYLPRMCEHARGLAAAFRACGIDAEVLPETTRKGIELARKQTSGKECYPVAVTAADLLTKVGEAGFEASRSAFFMPGGGGPCRFGQYSTFQRMLLDEVGYADVPIFSPAQDETLYKETGAAVGKDFDKLAWRGVVAYDQLTKSLHETRPYERTVGAANEVYAHYLDRIEQAVEAGAKDLPGVLREMRGDFEAVHSGAERKPRVGVVGEIFVRSNVFSNENLIEKLEEQGLECWLAPMDEWIFYVGCMSRRRARWGGDIPQWLYLHLKDRWQKSVAHKYEACMHGFLETGAEISVEEVLKKAEPYIDDTFEGEAVLSVGKAIDMCEKGCVGVVNAHPFGCMPGTISAALLREIGKRFGAPMVSVPYDGTQSPTTRLTLEAFAEQAKALKQAVERLAASAS